MKKHFVAVAGNIGVGKSTLVELLAKRLQWEPFYEPVGENPYLADFYHDMRAWAFPSQIFFLTRRLLAHRQLLDHPTSVIQDRTVYEDAEIFAQNLYLQRHMNERDYVTYRDLYQVLSNFLLPQTWSFTCELRYQVCKIGFPNVVAIMNKASKRNIYNA